MSFSAPSNGIIEQTGSDLNLSGLTGNSGVTITVDQGLTYYDFGVNRLSIKGGLKLDPESEVAIFQHDQNPDGDGAALSISGTQITSWKYGFTIAYNSEGNAVLTFTSDTVYEVGQSLFIQGITGDSSDSLRRFNDLPHLIRSISSDTREVTLDYKDIGDTLATSGGSRIASYPGFEYGGEYTGYGKTRTSRGTGIFITGQTNSNWHPSGYGMSGGSRTKFRANGGTIVITKPWSFGSHVEWKDLKIVNPIAGWSPEARGMATGYITNVELVNMSIGNFSSLYTKEFNLVNASFFRTFGNTYELPLFNVDTNQNTNGYDFGDASGTGHGHTLVKAYNPSAGSSFRSMWRGTTGSVNQSNVTETYRNVSINITDIANNPLPDVKVHVKDNPSEYAKNTALRNKSGGSHSYSVSISAATPAVVTFTSHGFATGDCVAIYNFPDASGISGADVVNGRKKITVIDADSFSLQDFDGSDVVGTINHAVGDGKLATAIEYNNLSAKEYLNTSDSNGEISEFSILTGAQIKEYNTSERAALQSFGGPYAIDDYTSAWKDNAENRGASYADWDTDKFGGFYKVDRRGQGNTTEDIFNFNFCAYDKMLGTSARSLLGTQTLSFDWLLFDDSIITDTRATTDAYTVIETPQKFYNRAKAYLTDNYAGETSTIVSREGNTINAGSYDVVLDASASSVFEISGNTLTIKATTFVGNISTTGTTTLFNDAKVIGTFGATTVLPWEIKNIEATSRLQLYNVTKDAVVVTQKLTGIAYNKTTLLELAGLTYAVTLRHDGAFIDATSVEVIANGSASSSWTLQSGAVQFNVGSSGVLGSALIQDDTDIKVDLLQGNENNTVTATTTISSSEFNDEAITNSSGNVDTSGTYTSSEIATGDVVRLRVTCVVGATAMLPLEVTGVASSSGLSFSISQEEDSVYNTNAIDGSAISTWTADFSNTPMGVDLSEADGGATVQEIYAFMVYSQTSINGVDKWFNVVRAIDGSNYQIDQAIANIKIQNLGDVAVNITGGRIFRKDGASVLHAVDGDKPLSLDTGALVANIQPQLESALNSNAKISSTNNNSKLIPSLL